MKKLTVLLVLLIGSTLAGAGIYEWADKERNIHFSDTPVPGAILLDSLVEGQPSAIQRTVSSGWQVKVVGVADGDTITVLYDGREKKIRLYGVDCPEKRQSFGKRAKQFTSNMVFKKNVHVRPVTSDRYGRTVAWVYADGMCLNEELLRAGMAWHYKKYSSDSKLAELEAEARQRTAGLWSIPCAVPPWDFRHGKKTTIIARLETKVRMQTSVNTREEVYHGNRKTQKFHRPGCRYYDCSNCTAVFHSRTKAIRAGYVPCKVCRP